MAQLWIIKERKPGPTADGKMGFGLFKKNFYTSDFQLESLSVKKKPTVLLHLTKVLKYLIRWMHILEKNLYNLVDV